MLTETGFDGQGGVMPFAGSLRGQNADPVVPRGVDKIVGQELIANKKGLKQKGIKIQDLS